MLPDPRPVCRPGSKVMDIAWSPDGHDVCIAYSDGFLIRGGCSPLCMSAIMRLSHVHNLETDSPDDLILAPESLHYTEILAAQKRVGVHTFISSPQVAGRHLAAQRTF